MQVVRQILSGLSSFMQGIVLAQSSVRNKRRVADTWPAGLMLCRETVRDSQMTVPETPSPEFVARGRARRPLASFQQPSALGARTGSDTVRLSPLGRF